MNPYRKDFPIFEGNDKIYFDNAATTQRPARVFAEMTAFNDTCNANPLRGLYAWSVEATDRYEQARHTAAAFIGAAQDCQIIFTRNATESINLVAYTWGMANVGEGDEILISIMEHHSNILPWQMVARQKKARLVYLECLPDGTITDEEIESKLTDRTKLVGIGHVSNVMGVTNPVEKIIALAHQKGAVVLVDGAQSAPHMPIDVRKWTRTFSLFPVTSSAAPWGSAFFMAKRNCWKTCRPS